MKLESAQLNKVYFDNYGPRRFFSADFEVGAFSQNYPALAFPPGEEDKIKQKFIDVFNFDKFNQDEGFSTHVIKDRTFIFGIVNPLGRIFSLQTMYLDDNNLIRSIKELPKHIESIEKEYPSIDNLISREEKINSIIALYLLDGKDAEMVEKIKNYYRMLLIRSDLFNNLKNNNNNPPKMKL